MERKKFDLLEQGGGQNDGPPASHIQDREHAAVTNFYTYGQTLIRRNGYSALTGGAGLGEAVTTPFAYHDNGTGDFFLFVFTLTGLKRVDGAGFVSLPRAEGGAFTSSPKPWCVEQYRNIGYGIRDGVGTLQRFTPDFIQNAGIAAPASSPTIADGGAGALTPGAYRGVVTYYNRNTGAEGNPCAASAPVTLVGAKQIAWTGIPVPALPGQITSRRLYRTLTDQQGEYFFVAQLDDIVTTAYTDNVVSSNLGDAASFRNALPPVAQAKYLRFWKERCWLASDDSVYFSEPGLPESFYVRSVIQVYPDDGSQITAIYGWSDRLVIGKTKLIAYLVGTDESDFSLQVLSEKHGVASHHSVRAAEGNLIWYGGDNFYKSGGETPQSISTYKVRKIVDAIPADERENVYAVVYPRRSWYLASVPQGSGARKVLCYNYKTETWSVFDHFDAVGFLAEALDEDGLEAIYATLANAVPVGTENDHAYHYDNGDADRGNAITASILSKAFAFGSPGKLTAIEAMRLLCQQIAGSATLSVYRNLEAVAIKSRLVSLDYAGPWKEYALSTRRTPGTLMQWGLSYTGATPLELDGVSLDVLLTEQQGMRAH